MNRDIDFSHFVPMVVVILNTPEFVDDYNDIVKKVFKIIEALAAEDRNTVISMLLKRIDDVKNIDIKAVLLRSIQDHKTSDNEEDILLWIILK